MSVGPRRAFYSIRRNEERLSGRIVRIAARPGMEFLRGLGRGNPRGGRAGGERPGEPVIVPFQGDVMKLEGDENQ